MDPSVCVLFCCCWSCCSSSVDSGMAGRGCWAEGGGGGTGAFDDIPLEQLLSVVSLDASVAGGGGGGGGGGETCCCCVPLSCLVLLLLPPQPPFPLHDPIPLLTLPLLPLLSPKDLKYSDGLMSPESEGWAGNLE